MLQRGKLTYPNHAVPVNPGTFKPSVYSSLQDYIRNTCRPCELHRHRRGEGLEGHRCPACVTRPPLSHGLARTVPKVLVENGQRFHLSARKLGDA